MNMVYVLSWSCLLRQTNRETIYLFNTRRRGYFVSFCEYVSRYIRVYVLCNFIEYAALSEEKNPLLTESYR